MSGNIFKIAVTALISLLTLTACGGGGGENTPSAGSTPPATTSQSPNIAASQSSIDFGGVVVENSSVKTIVIQNTGDADLAIGNIAKPDLPFTIINDTCSNKTVSPSKSCSVDVTFRPAVQNIYTSKVTIPSNDPDAGSVGITVNGYGNGLNAWINQIDKSNCPQKISFGVTVNNPKDLNSVLTLNEGNFSLYENGSAIGGFILAPPKPTPLSVVMAIDSSESIAQTKTNIATAANSFIDQLSLTDEVAIYKFNFYIDYFPDTTNFIIANDSGKISLHDYINETFPIQPGTRLLDAAYDSITKAALGSNNNKIVIILSDGNEVSGSAAKTFEEVVAIAKEKGIPLFTVYYLGEGGNPQLLERLAQETGGQYYDSTPPDTDLTTILKQIFKIVSNEYTLSYTPLLGCNRTITLGVKVDNNNLFGEDSETIKYP